MIKDTIGVILIALFAVCFFTNAVTDQYNFWALCSRYL
jgi:hypothetical protein